MSYLQVTDSHAEVNIQTLLEGGVISLLCHLYMSNVCIHDKHVEIHQIKTVVIVVS